MCASKSNQPWGGGVLTSSQHHNLIIIIIVWALLGGAIRVVFSIKYVIIMASSPVQYSKHDIMRVDYLSVSSV